MMLYIIISYLVTLGMIIESYKDKSVPTEAYFIWALSPITLPIIIGMEISEKRKQYGRVFSKGSHKHSLVATGCQSISILWQEDI